MYDFPKVLEWKGLPEGVNPFKEGSIHSKLYIFLWQKRFPVYMCKLENKGKVGNIVHTGRFMYKGYIILNEECPLEKIERVLVHETVHAIQFIKGGSKSYKPWVVLKEREYWSLPKEISQRLEKCYKKEHWEIEAEAILAENRPDYVYYVISGIL